MRRHTMIGLCDMLLIRLNEADMLQQHLTAKHRAFVLRSLSEVHELQQIAKLETINNVTTEQITHINQICDQLAHIFGQLPKSVLDLFYNGED